MAPIIRETRCGFLVDPTDVAAVAAGLREVLDAPAGEREAMGRRGLEAAHATYNWESQATRLLDEYSRLTGRRW